MQYRAENGSLMVTMEVKARCPGGDILSTDRLRVTIRDQLGRICSAVFDFSDDPVVIGEKERSPPSSNSNSSTEPTPVIRTLWARTPVAPPAPRAS